MILRNYWQHYHYQKFKENYRKVIVIKKIDLSPTPSRDPNFVLRNKWTAPYLSIEGVPFQLINTLEIMGVALGHKKAVF